MTSLLHPNRLGALFEYLEKERGECVDMPFGFQSTESSPCEWEWYSHVNYDGLGVISELADKLKAKIVIPELRVRPTEPPSSYEFIREFLELLRRPEPAAFPWTPRGSGKPERRIPPLLMALTKEETDQVLRQARQSGVSANSHVLWGLSVALRPFAERPADPQYWTIPINMRGAVKESHPYGNHISYVRLPIHEHDTALILQQRLSEFLQRGRHWVMYTALGWIGAHPSIGATSALSTGIFSNVGAFECESPGSPYRIFAAPPTSEDHPLAACILSWNGRMSISLALLPPSSPPPESLRELHDKWRKLLLGS